MYYELQNGTHYQLNGKCPVCGSPAHIRNIDYAMMAMCRICGRFRYGALGEAVLEGLRGYSNNRLYRVSHILRTTSDRAKGTSQSSLFPIYSRADFEEMLDRPDPSIQEKLDLLLKYLAELSPFPGAQCSFDNANDYSVLCAKNSTETDFYIKSLRDQEYLTGDVIQKYDGGPSICTNFTLSTKGWTELDRIAKSGSDSSKAFVAMWFNPSRKVFFDAIKQAIEDAWYASVRVDMVEHVNRIDDEIIAQIRQCRFLVADLSGQRNGVYFEAGFMLGLGRPVIWACEKEELDKVHFDTRQYNTIDYTDAADLRSRLRFRIEAILGKGAHKPE